MRVYRLLIVDDEVNIREGITTAVPWAEHGIEVVGQAADGTEGLAAFRADKPDIVITDIQMDHMNGLEFAAKVREDDPAVKVIIISGYDNFEYVQRALELRTFSYILKPVLPDELLEVVKRCIREIEDERGIRARMEAFDTVLEQSRAQLTEHLVRDLVEGRIGDLHELRRRAELLSVELEGPGYVCLLFSLDGYGLMVRSDSARELYRKVLGVRAIVAGILGQERSALVVSHDGGDVVALLCAATGATTPPGLDERIRRIQESVRAHLGVTVSVGVSRVYDDPLALEKAFRETVRCLEYRLVVGRDSVITASDASGMASVPHVYPSEAEARVLRCLAEEDATALRTVVTAFFEDLESQHCAASEVAGAATLLVAAVARQFASRGLEPREGGLGELRDIQSEARGHESIQALAAWLAGRLARELDELRSRRGEHVKSVIRRVQDYVLRNYTRPDLSLEQVAEYACLSVSYLSKLYKREAGQSYLDTIVGLRMEEAKRRLRTTNARVADVGAAVGYTNPQYFGTLFKKVVGHTPAQYREQGDG